MESMTPPRLEDLPALVAALSAGDAAATEAAAALSPPYLWTREIVEAGGIAPLIELLHVGSEGAKEHATGALWNLAYNDDTKAAVAEAGAIAPLVELLRSGREGAQENAAAALMNLSVNQNLSVNDAYAAAIAEAGGIAPLIELLCSGSDDAKEDAVGALRNLANNDAYAVEIAAAGGIAPLEQYVGDAQEDAVEALEKVRAAVEAQAAAQQERQAAAARVAAAAEAAARSERWKAERVQAGVDEHMPEPPKRHVCSLTHEAMIDPVIDALGNTYERAAIERWLRGHNTSPLTGAVLPHKELTPNIVLKSIIQEWEEEAHEECMAMAQAPQTG